ncbi:DUF1642 domain-containing protein [Lactococcus lactis subsp. lactis]|uniref:DUF1642 domain-containing protein n=1 Tax=Lactococcus lactis TaxID=1358 RepID=UPI002648C563|nr:DUF1642 domain-containing protein [Lactococcus lactis]WKB49220.1 DUF1642 domain-containing protein [Lactococcus lactis subsp. lactis]
MKRPTSHISQNSIKPALSKAVEFYTDNNRQAYECIHERDEYIDYLESKLSNAKPQQALPVVPECVAEWIECVKGKNNNALALLDDDNMPDDVNEWLFFQRNDDNINLILRAWLDGYTVEKPQLFYLRDELTGQFLAKDNQFKNEDRYFFWNGADPLTHSIGTAWKLSFTQQEIDSMQTGSYELVPVEDGE